MEGLPERLGPWQRQPGANGKKRRGGLSTEEQGYVAAWQDASARLDAACETAEALGQRVQEQDATIETKDSMIEHLRVCSSSRISTPTKRPVSSESSSDATASAGWSNACDRSWRY